MLEEEGWRRAVERIGCGDGRREVTEIGHRGRVARYAAPGSVAEVALSNQQLKQLVDQFRVGDDKQKALRRELEKAAPHAFAKPASPPARAAAKAPAVAAKPPAWAAAKAAPSAPVKRAKAAGGGRGADDWSEF